MGFVRAVSPDTALRADPAGAGAPSRDEAKALARPAGAAEDSGATAALDGRAPAKATQAGRSVAAKIRHMNIACSIYAAACGQLDSATASPEAGAPDREADEARDRRGLPKS